MNNDLGNRLSFAKKAHKIILGFDLVKATLISGEARLVLISKDLSEKTKKEVLYLTKEFEVETITIDITLDELWYLLGKRAGVISVIEETFADKIRETCNNVNQ